MDKPVSRPRGLSRGFRLAAAGAILAIAALVFALPTIRRWVRAERSIAASRVRIGEVTRGLLVRDASADGRIVAALHPTLFTPAAGIVSLAVKAGDPVRRGQILARVESPELKSRLAQERATLASAKSTLDRQRIDARQDAVKNTLAINLLEVRLEAARRLGERAQTAFDEGILNKNDYEKARDDIRIAELKTKNAKETAKLAGETADFDIRSKRAFRGGAGRLNCRSRVSAGMSGVTLEGESITEQILRRCAPQDDRARQIHTSWPVEVK